MLKYANTKLKNDRYDIGWIEEPNQRLKALHLLGLTSFYQPMHILISTRCVMNLF
ncbi:hypothetical protein [Halotia branconii]|uniref:Uncharacterized protein n=1 Tax=Halotia branconii CENA392 TaxID=1539056 RepID=A0AAJ6PBF0_9CYAN|nr:hypothetical protein [Halotia branconii]WGV27746.1 hypothetical protein QI031_09785 [Halotia branconii CENA392]